MLLAAPENKKEEIKTIRTERNYIRKGNEMYNAKRYADAEVEYRKALQENKDSEIGMYNLAAALIRQAAPNDDPNDKKSPISQARTLLNDLTSIGKNTSLMSKAFYNLGNMDFNKEDYGKSIEMYKSALRLNPNDEQARQNLRLAQKKQQQQQQQNKDNKDQDKQQDKDKQQNQDKQDKKDQDKKDQDKQQQPQNNNQQNKEDKKEKQEPQQATGSPDNSEQILNAVQDNEKGTQQKINAARAKEQENERRRTKNQW